MGGWVGSRDGWVAGWVGCKLITDLDRFYPYKGGT